jgi:hypothetical protein
MVNHARSLALQLAQWSLELDHREAELERRRRDLGQQGRIFRQRQ